MLLSKLPAAIATFLDATKAGDGIRLKSAFADDAVLIEGEQTFVGDGIGDWNARRHLGADVRLQPINAARRGGRMVLTVIAEGDPTVSGFERPSQRDICFELRGGKIAKLEVAASPALPVVGAVAAFIHSTNIADLEGLMATFCDDALVNDQLQEFWGKAAIREWAKEDIVGRRTTMYVTEVVEHHKQIFIRANVDGDYDKRGLPDPLNLSFHFFVPDQEIAQLLILQNSLK